MPQLSQLADLVDGKIINGDPAFQVEDVKTIDRAGESHLTFVSDQAHFEKFLNGSAGGAVVSRNIAVDFDLAAPFAEKAIVEVENAETAFTRLAQEFRNEVERPRIGVSSAAQVDSTAMICKDVDIYPGAFVGANCVIGKGSTIYPGVCLLENCEIGENVQIFPNAVLYENTKVGDNSIVHAGAVLGAFGFGYKSSANGHELSAQLGNVELGVKVEIGANTTIDRGTFDSTTIGDGTKIDDLVMIGHNCQVGQHNLLCSQVGIAGSCTTGDFVVMAGQVGIGDHLNIGSKAILMAKAGLMHNVPEGETYLGIPATPVREQMQILAVKAKLPEMRKSLKKVTKQLAAVEAKLTTDATQKEAA